MNDMNDINYIETLKTRFKYPAFREKQLDIIKALLEGKRDVCVTMFTGAGKSLCYQFPAVHTNKITIVVSPLIALMNDQCIKLSELGINSTCLNSMINKNKIEKEIIDMKYNIVYTTPEYLVEHEQFIKKLDSENKLVVVAIDESHCVSMWGNDFRSAYLRLGVLKEWIKNAPLISLTATATPKVENDIMTTLKLQDPLMIRTTFDRPNLYIKVIQKANIQDPIKFIVSFIKNEPSIVYCQTRKETETVTSLLKQYNVKCESYHAGMDGMERECVHEEFSTDKITTVVATVAFGMGIDKVIRNIVHYGTPKDMESYYQEIGRAGRDFKKSKCILLYSKGDIPRLDFFIKNITDPIYRRHKSLLMNTVKNYINSIVCRRKSILNYFGEKYTSNNCQMCDNCLKNNVLNDNPIQMQLTKKVNVTNECYNVIKTITITGNIYGPNAIVGLLRGSKAKTTPIKFYGIPTYRVGQNKPEEWWKTLIRFCVENDILQEVPITKAGYSGISLKVTDYGNTLFNQKEQIIIEVPDDLTSFLKYVTEVHIPTPKKMSDTELFNVLENPVLVDTISPVKGPVKEPVKEQVREAIKESVKGPVKEQVKEPIKESVKEPVKGPVKEQVKEPVKEQVKEAIIDTTESTTETQPNSSKTLLETYKLYKEGKTIDEISKLREIKTNTVEDHLVKLHNSGYNLDTIIRLGLTDDVKKRIQTVITDKPTAKLRDIHRKLKDCSYIQIKLTMQNNVT